MINLTVPNAANGFNPPVKSVIIKRPGCVTGTRLVSFQSLNDYLNDEAKKQLKEAEKLQSSAA